jgi:hypothetical protein
MPLNIVIIHHINNIIIIYNIILFMDITAIKNNREEKIKIFQTHIINTYTALKQKVTDENNRLKNTYDKYNGEHSADAQKSKYVGLSEQILKNIYFYSFWIYIVLSLVLFVFVYNNQSFSMIIKVLLFVTIFGFPFYIYFLENFTYIICMYLYNIMVSTIYHNGYSNTSIEYGGEMLHEVMSQTAKSPPLSFT